MKNKAGDWLAGADFVPGRVTARLRERKIFTVGIKLPIFEDGKEPALLLRR
jgi:hypothetical protein